MLSIGPVRFSSFELFELGKAWIALSVAFTILFRQSLGIPRAFVYALIAVAVALLFREIVRKLVAQWHHCWVFLWSNPLTLILAVISSFFGLVFAVPGGVVIRGALSPARSGKIALSGPLANMALAVFFSILSFIPVISGFASASIVVNEWLALFNLLPFPKFDGEIVFDWDKAWYFSALILSAVIIYF